jgi:proton-translocating NAD(P)+ transhydrogenase subunit alpha
MKVLVPAESRRGENRVALVPESVAKLRGMGLTVAVQAGAGVRSGATDDDYRQAGAEVIATDFVAPALGVTDVVTTVRPLHPRAVDLLKPGAITLSFLQPVADLQTVAAAARAEATALSFDLIPRISRAQAMDALTSQAMVAGYRAVLVAAERLPRFFPLSMTAAGTIPPARVLVLGAGVAGLQAIATARRLGAVVTAYDVRAASAEEVRSLGATFLDLGLGTAEGEGGYAREMSDERAQRQRDLLAAHVAAADVVITTAAVPGHQAPQLVTADAVSQMRPGSVVVDLAAESGGNVEGSQPGSVAQVGSATLIGGADVPSQLPVHASALYSANVVAVLGAMTHAGVVSVDLDDEVMAGCVVVHHGTVRNPVAAELLGLRTGHSSAPRGTDRAVPADGVSRVPADESPAGPTSRAEAEGQPVADAHPSGAGPEPAGEPGTGPERGSSDGSVAGPGSGPSPDETEEG